MSAIKNRGITFYNKIINGECYKTAESSIRDPDMSFISFSKSLNYLNQMLNDIELALNNQFDLIEDPDITNEFGIASITPTNIEFYDIKGENIIGTASLEDFKELIEAWRDFLLQPPLHGSKV